MIGNRENYTFKLGKFSHSEAERLRFLRTNFLSETQKSEDELKVVLCTVDNKADELARATLGLACALAAVGKKILVIDIDRKNAKVGELTENTGRTYNDFLAGRATVDELGEKTCIDGLDVIVSVPDSSVDMRDDSKTSELIGKLKERYDFVFVVATPVSDGADAFSCDDIADAVILFLKKRSTRLGFVNKMKDYYEGRSRRVIGAVLI